MVAIQRILLSSHAPIQGLAKNSSPLMKGVDLYEKNLY